jgi:hypothetical protein
MSLRMKSAILVAVSAAMFPSCEKPTARFHPGEKVRVKLTNTTGVIAVRLSPSVEDLYYLKVPGKQSALDKREWFYQWYEANEPSWHIEGPYYDTDLQVSR